MNPEDVSNAIRKSEGSLSHYPNGSLVCVENTAQGGGGTVYSQESVKMTEENQNLNVQMDLTLFHFIGQICVQFEQFLIMDLNQLQ